MILLYLIILLLLSTLVCKQMKVMSLSRWQSYPFFMMFIWICIIDAQLDRKYSSERDLAVHHLKITEDNDLLLYDRAYYAYRFVLLYVLQKREFCFRLKKNACSQVKDFISSGKKQQIIIFNPTKDM